MKTDYRFFSETKGNTKLKFYLSSTIYYEAGKIVDGLWWEVLISKFDGNAEEIPENDFVAFSLREAMLYPPSYTEEYLIWYSEDGSVVDMDAMIKEIDGRYPPSPDDTPD
jgi:hypothetical protein